MSEGPRFTDDKEADALRTIGEVASALNIRQHVLRYWEDQFPMLKPLKRSGGRRYYRPEDVALVERIDRLVHREGYTLRGARLALEGKGGSAPAAAAQPAPMPDEPGFAMRARLVALRHTLATALQDS
jgi:DNA-binding transcriptional MerR regulator